MIKNCLFAVALASLALAGGCAKGGNGIVPPPPSVAVSITTPAGTNPGAIYPGQPLTLTATVSNSTNTAVTWSLSCSGAANSCGTLTPVTPPTTPATAAFTAPPCVSQAMCLSGSEPTITATLTSDTSIAGPLALTIVDITTDIAPASLSIGTGLTQQFTAVAVPDGAPQTFTWSCNVGGSGGPSCAPANFCYGSNCNPAIASGLAIYTYTAADSCNGKGCIQISANSTLDPNICANSTNCTIAKVSPVASRISGTYAFQFSGYDKSNNPIAVVGIFTVAGGSISGVEEVLTNSGPSAQNPIQITDGSYTPTSSDTNNSNNAGALTLTLPAGVYPNQFQVVLDGGGDIEMIESDTYGTGSGIAQISSYKSFTGLTDQTYAFGFTGVDFGGNRVGYVGLLPMNGSGMVVGGQMDVNDDGNASNICGSPCSITSGSYTADQNISGLWHMTLTPAGAAPMNFDFFISSGTTNKTNPLTFYAISTDPIITHPAVSGTMVLQDNPQTYNSAFFKGTSVSALTGTVAVANATCTAPPCTNVSLTLGTTDGNGNFSGQFDQNNAGTILSSVQFPGTSQSPSPYTYAASGTGGRYTFNMLGNPTANPVVAPLPFVLYASGANRGFLLDQSSSSVMTGTMNPEGQAYLGFPGSALPGTYAAATTSSGSSGVDPIADNLLLIWANPTQGAPCTSECVNGTQYDSLNYSSTGTPLALAYTLQDTGNGTIVPISPATTPNYVIYVQDISGCTKTSGPVCAIQDFLMMDVDPTNPYPSIIFAQQ